MDLVGVQEKEKRLGAAASSSQALAELHGLREDEGCVSSSRFSLQAPRSDCVFNVGELEAAQCALLPVPRGGQAPEGCALLDTDATLSYYGT